MIGTTIGHYRVTGQLGKGGMGEVYRAADDRLNRDVAVKVLPPTFAEDASRLTRFQREAQLLASLNHANIAQIYGLEEHGGQQAIILELVEGETLDEKIRRGPLPYIEAHALALQIADALESAHEKGIIHRDLKPANVKVTPEGTVKVLDFGLAKALSPDPAQQEMSHSPTLTAAATQAGVLMGTAAYMSPEQARGKPVDRRADIWAFGCVLYEMLVGRKPFEGSDVSEMLAHVITREPDLDELPSDLPGPVSDLIERCLRKDPRMRVPDIGAARIALLEGQEASTAAMTEPEVAGARRPGGLMLLAAGMAGLLVGVLAAWVLLSGPTPETSPVGNKVGPTHFDLLFEPPLADPRMAISPDGRQLVYSGREEGSRHLYLRRLDAFGVRLLPGTEGGHSPFFAQAGRRIGFFASGRLKVMNLEGGLPEPICAVSGEVDSAVWGRDDSIVYSSTTLTTLNRVRVPGGEPEPVAITGLEEGARLMAPRPLPVSGKVLATLDAPSLDGPRLAVVDLESRSLETVARGHDARYVEPGHLLYIQQDRVMEAPFDLTAGKLTAPGREASLEEAALRPGAYGGFESLAAAVSADGVIVYPAGRFGSELELHRVDIDGGIEPTGGAGSVPRSGPDGRQVVVLSEGDVWLLDLESGSRTQLTFQGTATYPLWSGDGQEVLFGDRRAGAFSAYSVPLDGRGTLRVTVAHAPELPSPIPTSSHPDVGMLFYTVHPETNRDIFLLSKDGDVIPILTDDVNTRAGSIRPDGKFFAYVTDETGSDEVFIRELPDTGRRWQVSRTGGLSPVWSQAGEEIFYRSGDAIMAAMVSGAGTLRVDEPREVFASYRLEHDPWGNKTFDVMPDGTLLVSLREPDEVTWRAVTRWTPAGP